MDIWGPKLIWRGINRRIIIQFFLFFFFSDNGITNYIFFTTCYDKITCCEKNKNCDSIIRKEKRILTSLTYCIYYKTHWYTHSSRFEPNISWRHTKVLTTKLQIFINIDFFKFLLYLVWNCLGNSHFNICFLFQNI
jgi:hypothetical protein